MTTYEQNLALTENSELRGRIAELEACKESLELLICKIWAGLGFIHKLRLNDTEAARIAERRNLFAVADVIDSISAVPEPKP